MFDIHQFSQMSSYLKASVRLTRESENIQRKNIVFGRQFKSYSSIISVALCCSGRDRSLAICLKCLCFVCLCLQLIVFVILYLVLSYELLCLFVRICPFTCEGFGLQIDFNSALNYTFLHVCCVVWFGLVIVSKFR